MIVTITVDSEPDDPVMELRIERLYGDRDDELLITCVQDARGTEEVMWTRKVTTDPARERAKEDD